jgi:hypothetical protein
MEASLAVEIKSSLLPISSTNTPLAYEPPPTSILHAKKKIKSNQL